MRFCFKQWGPLNKVQSRSPTHRREKQTCRGRWWGEQGEAPPLAPCYQGSVSGPPRGKVAHTGRWGPRRWQWYHGAGPWAPWGPALADSRPCLSSPCPSLLRAQPASLVGEGSQASLGFGNSRVKFPLGASLLAPHKNIRKATGGRLGPSLELSSQIWGRAQVVSSKCPDPLTMVYHLRSLLVRAWLGAHRYGSCRPGLGAEWGSGKGVGSKSSRHGGVRILAPPPVTSSRQDASSETPSQPVSFRSQSLWQPVSVCARHLPLPLHLQLQDRGTVAPAT